MEQRNQLVSLGNDTSTAYCARTKCKIIMLFLHVNHFRNETNKEEKTGIDIDDGRL